MSFSSAPAHPERALSETNAALGTVVFLNEYTQDASQIKCVQPSCQCGNTPISPRACAHPALLIGLWSEESQGGEKMALIGIITSNPKPTPDARTVPIVRGSTETYDSSNPEKHFWLESRGSMWKVSYLLVDHVYMVPFSQLRPLNNTPFANRLTEESYQRVMKIYNIATRTWVPTPILELGCVTDPSFSASFRPHSLQTSPPPSPPISISVPMMYNQPSTCSYYPPSPPPSPNMPNYSGWGNYYPPSPPGPVVFNPYSYGNYYPLSPPPGL